MNIEALQEAIRFVAGYAGDVTDWMIIKKELLKTLSPADRIFFSTRDPVTKKQQMNAFEEVIAEKWYQITGNRLILINRHDSK